MCKAVFADNVRTILPISRRQRAMRAAPGFHSGRNPGTSVSIASVVLLPSQPLVAVARNVV